MTAKFDSAIVVSESLEEAEDFLKIAVFCLMAISPFFLMLCFVFEEHLIQMFGITVEPIWLYVSIFGSFCVAAANLFKSWLNYLEDYKRLRTFQVTLVVAICSLTIFFGLVTENFFGLLLGFIVAHALCVSIFFIKQGLSNSLRPCLFDQKLYVLFKKNLSIPLLNASSVIFDRLSGYLLLFVLNFNHSAEFVGLYALVLRVIQSPLGVVSQGVSRVFAREVTRRFQNGGSPQKYAFLVFLTLLLCSLAPLSLLYPYAKEIFGFLFGEEWSGAGLVFRILMPVLCLKFAVSTISPVFVLTKQNRLLFLWRLSALILPAIILWQYSTELSSDNLLRLSVAYEAFLYIAYLGLILFALGSDYKGKK